MTYRYTVETLASGQPRPYADSHYRVRVTFEVLTAPPRLAPAVEAVLEEVGDFAHLQPANVWVKNPSWKEPEVRALLPHLRCGFPIKEPENWASTRLDWLREIEPGVWEFHTTSPYTD